MRDKTFVSEPVEEVLTIADHTSIDPHDRRIRVDTRKWLLSKDLPKVYGDKVTVAGDRPDRSPDTD